jgi:hypothetical protein
MAFKPTTKGRGGKSKPPSPLYTSKNRELTKREIVASQGRDTDGAYRAYDRKDTPSD